MSVKSLKTSTSGRKTENDECNITPAQRFLDTKKGHSLQSYSFWNSIVSAKSANKFIKWGLCLLAPVLSCAIWLVFIGAKNDGIANTFGAVRVNNNPNNFSLKTTTVKVPLDPKDAVILFTTTNHDSKNVWYKLNKITVTLANKDSDYLVDIPIIVLKPLPKGHAAWKCTYVFGSINNHPNSCTSSNRTFFSNNTFHLHVPSSVFVNAKNKNTENIYCQITVNFMIWDPINGKWFNWYFYDLTTRIDYERLVNCVSKISVTNLNQTTITYQLVSSFSIIDGKLTNIVSHPVLFSFKDCVTNYHTSNIVKITMQPGEIVKSVAGFIAVPKLDLFAFTTVSLDFSTVQKNNYVGKIRNTIYYDFVNHQNSIIRSKTSYFTSGHCLFYNYLKTSHFYLNDTFFISTYVNITVNFAILISLKSVFDPKNPAGIALHRYSDNFVPNMQDSVYHKGYNYNDIKNILR